MNVPWCYLSLAIAHKGSLIRIPMTNGKNFKARYRPTFNSAG